MVKDKKPRGTYSETGDDDINDVAAMGGVNLAEEANVSFLASIVYIYLPVFVFIIFTANHGSHGICGVPDKIVQG